MAEEQTKVDRIVMGIHDTLMATGRFEKGLPYGTDDVPRRPAFMLWWDGFSVADSDLGDRSPHLSRITHRIQVDIYVDMQGKADEEKAQRRLRLVGQEAVKAIHQNHKLGGACLGARVKSGETDFRNQNNMMCVLSLMVEADVYGW